MYSSNKSVNKQLNRRCNSFCSQCSKNMGNKMAFNGYSFDINYLCQYCGNVKRYRKHCSTLETDTLYENMVVNANEMDCTYCEYCGCKKIHTRNRSITETKIFHSDCLQNNKVSNITNIEENLQLYDNIYKNYMQEFSFRIPGDKLNNVKENVPDLTSNDDSYTELPSKIPSNKNFNDVNENILKKHNNTSITDHKQNQMENGDNSHIYKEFVAEILSALPNDKSNDVETLVETVPEILTNKSNASNQENYESSQMENENVSGGVQRKKVWGKSFPLPSGNLPTKGHTYPLKQPTKKKRINRVGNAMMSFNSKRKPRPYTY